MLDPELDGTGGGFGKNRGLTVRDISERFNNIAAEPNMRSFTAILRIAREQLEARGDLSAFKWMFVAAVAVTLLSAIGIAVLGGSLREVAIKAAIGGLVASAAFAVGLTSTRKQTRSAIAQERAIRELTIDALVQVATGEGFKPKPLDFTQRHFLVQVLKKTKRAEPSLTSILEMAGE